MTEHHICADPFIFCRSQAQSDDGFKSIADLYQEAGLDGLWEGENGEIAGMERIHGSRRGSGLSRRHTGVVLDLRAHSHLLAQAFLESL